MNPNKIYNPRLFLRFMSARNALEIKEKMISIFKSRGPSLPVHIAKGTDLSILFASAFLSELIGEKKLKISSMKVGSSPLYFLSGQEPMLENFSEYLKGKEKEAFNILRERKFMKDSETEPPIRVALREIKDFAVPFKVEGEIYWKYFTANESEFISSKFIEDKPKFFHKIQFVEKKPEVFKETIEENIPKAIVEIEKSIEEIAGKMPARIRIKKISPKKKKTKENEKFLDLVKEFLSKSSVEIISIEGLKKDELILKVKVHGEEQILAAYNKRKISEKDIIKASKKASEFNLRYSVLSMGELPRKISELIEALKGIKDIEKIE